MDFRIKLPLRFSAHQPEAKFSIRLSILSIVLILLIGVSALIISINYFSINSILIASARNTLFQSGGKIAEQIRSYLQPLNSNILTANRMFNEGIANPKDADFVRFLYGLIADNENLVAAYWGDPEGNVYWLNRDEHGYFEEIILRKDNKVIRATKRNLDAHGQEELATKKVAVADIDPRLRPWYQQAEKKKSLTWAVYRFLEVGSQNPQFGITSAFPVYDAQGKLRGVFGIDMLLGTIDSYVRSMEHTKNSFIFVINLTNGELITAHGDRESLLKLDEVPDINDIKAPWLNESFKIYQQKMQSPFIYSFGGKRYIGAYEKILKTKSDDPWYVAIATPVNDIIAPLLKTIFINMIFTILVLLLGVVMASIFSSSLSRPIKSLAYDANLICQLELANIKHLFSRIKEIADMADSFIKMRNALYSFQRYMPIALVKKLILSNKIAAVGGEAKDLTMLFTDIKHFTQLAENFTPEKLMQYLSEYFQHITKVIIETHGTVDKYVGDGVVAFWGAPIDDPEHVLHACQAALQVQKGLQQLNAKWRRENKPEVFTRFGISSGRVIVGNVGSDDRLSYTALGDHVNLASRMEGLNKVYGTAIMVSEFAYEKVKDKFQFRFLDRVAVKGKTQGIRVYELVGELGTIPDLEWERYNHDFDEAFASYEQGDWQRALYLFRDLYKKYPDDRVLKVFITRCSEFLDNPPLVWRGVWVMDEK